MIEIEILLTFVYFSLWSVLQYNVRMLFLSIETGTAMNARKSEKYPPISRSFSASKQCRDISGTTFFQGRDILGTTFNIHNWKQSEIPLPSDGFYGFAVAVGQQIHKSRQMAEESRTKTEVVPDYCTSDFLQIQPCIGFRCMKFKPLVIWIWNQNIAISTIVGTSSCINNRIRVVSPRESFRPYSRSPWVVSPSFINGALKNEIWKIPLQIFVFWMFQGLFMGTLFLSSS